MHVELGQHVHAVRGHPKEQPFVDGLARPTLADDDIDADPSQKHAERRSGDSAPDDDNPTDVAP